MIARGDAQANPGIFMVIVAEHLYGRAIDAKPGTFKHGRMSTTLQSTPRRSTRVFHKMRVQASGRNHNGRKFTETCQTLVVNAYGGLLLLKQEVNDGEMLLLVHPETLEEQECRIVYLGEPGDKGQRVGVEFLTPAPRFWGLDLGDSPLSGADASASSVH
jgi:hypothetical protein